MGANRLPIPGEEPWGALRALDWQTGETRWEFRVHTPPWCGVLSTAGGLVFSGTMEGDFFALSSPVTTRTYDPLVNSAGSGRGTLSRNDNNKKSSAACMLLTHDIGL